MYLVKCQFLKNEMPAGREYTYRSNEILKIGDIVQINDNSKGIITEVDVPEEEVEEFKDKLKTLVGKALEENIEHDEKEERNTERKFNLIRGGIVGMHLEMEEKQELIEFVNELEECRRKA